MDLGYAHSTIMQTNARNPLSLPPAPFAVALSQEWKYANAGSRGDRFDVGDLADDLQYHWATLSHSVPNPAFPPRRAGDGQRGLYCLIAPKSPQAALVLRVTGPGRVERRFRCPRPDRSTKKDKVPDKLGVLGKQLFLAFLEGNVVSYSLA